MQAALGVIVEGRKGRAGAWANPASDWTISSLIAPLPYSPLQGAPPQLWIIWALSGQLRRDAGWERAEEGDDSARTNVEPLRIALLHRKQPLLVSACSAADLRSSGLDTSPLRKQESHEGRHSLRIRAVTPQIWSDVAIERRRDVHSSGWTHHHILPANHGCADCQAQWRGHHSRTVLPRFLPIDRVRAGLHRFHHHADHPRKSRYGPSQLLCDVRNLLHAPNDQP